MTAHAPDDLPAEPTLAMPVLLVAELQDSLLAAMHDLHRLEGLVHHATNSLLARFNTAHGALARVGSASPAAGEVGEALKSAVTELQFEDMATQLIGHTARVLQGCAQRLAAQAMGPDDDGPAVPAELPVRPNPVTQSAMQAGSVELF